MYHVNGATLGWASGTVHRLRQEGREEPCAGPLGQISLAHVRDLVQEAGTAAESR